jgi:hypothetical protein
MLANKSVRIPDYWEELITVQYKNNGLMKEKRELQQHIAFQYTIALLESFR